MFSDIPFEFKANKEGTISVTSGNHVSELSVNDQNLQESLSEKDQQVLSEAEAIGKQKKIYVAAEKGNAIVNNSNSTNNEDSRLQVFTGIAKSNALNGIPNFSKDSAVMSLKQKLNPDDPKSILNTFSDTCDDSFEYTENTKTVYTGESKTCLAYKDSSSSCTVKHDYKIKVISEVSPEYPISLAGCTCPPHDTTCTEESLKNCVNFSLGYKGDNYLSAEGDDETACLGFRRVGQIRIDSPEALTKVVLNKADFDDVVAFFIYKENEKPDYSKTVWKSHAQLPVRNYWYAGGEHNVERNKRDLPNPNASISNFCLLKTINGHCAMPYITYTISESICSESGGCASATTMKKMKTYAPLIDLLSDVQIDDPLNKNVGKCQIGTQSEQPKEDITAYFKNAKPGEIYNLEMIVSVSGRGEGYLQFRAEYDPKKAIEYESWTPTSCINTANSIDWNSKFQKGLVYCSSYPETMVETKNGDYCAVLENKHIICSSAFESTPLKNVNAYNDNTNKYELTSINPLCQEVKVSQNSILSATEDYIQNSCSEMLKQAESEGKTCSQTKVVCKQTTRASEELEEGITTNSNNDCYLKEYTYNCGTYTEVPVTTVTKKTNCLDLVKTCEGGNCVGLDDDVNFANEIPRTSAILQAADFMAQDLTCVGTDGTNETQECEIFRGKKSKCHIFDSKATYQNCCKDITGANVNSYIATLLKVSRLMTSQELLGGMLNKIDPTKLTSKTLDSSLSITESAHAKLLSWVDSITGVEGSGALSENIAVTVLAAIYKDAIQEFIQETIKTIAIDITEAVGGLAGKVGADSVQEATVAMVDELKNESVNAVLEESATSEALQGIASAVSVVGMVYMIYTFVDLALKMAFKCDKEDFETASNRALKKCTAIGSKCKIKVMGKCVDRDYSYCCYSSPLARIINEQIAKTGQLRRSFPDKSCRGISVDDLSKLDWEKIDLTEWTTLIMSAGEYQFSEEQKQAQENLAEKQRNELANSVNNSRSQSSDALGELVLQYQDRFSDKKTMEMFNSLPLSTQKAIIHREKLNTLESQVSNRDTDEKALERWNSLPSETKEELLELEKLITKGYLQNYESLTLQEKNELNKKTEMLSNDSSSAEEFEIKPKGSTIDPTSESASNAVIATQMNLGLEDYCSLSIKQAARAIVEYRVAITNNAYEAVKNAYLSNEYSQGITKLIQNHQKEKCVAGSYKIAVKPATVENVTGEGSVLDINKSSSNPTNCSENDNSHRQSASKQLENTLENLKESGNYNTLEEYEQEV